MKWDGNERRTESRAGMEADVAIILSHVKETKEDVKRIDRTIHGNGDEPGLKTEVALNTNYRENALKEKTNRKTNLYVMIAAILTAVIALVIAINGG